MRKGRSEEAGMKSTALRKKKRRNIHEYKYSNVAKSREANDESEESRKNPFWYLATCTLLVGMLIAGGLAVAPLYDMIQESRQQNQEEPVQQVLQNQTGFPSFLQFQGNPINVTYDARSIRLNDEPALFISGSMHPTRASRVTWIRALNDAVRHGLNMVTIYVMWAAHQPFYSDEDDEPLPLDWSLPSSLACQANPELSCDGGDGGGGEAEWTLARAIDEAGKRGLFVHIRIGPYVCAEYSYGGIPEWVGVQYGPNIHFRRAHLDWLNAMQTFVTETVHYLTENELWAYQGGPIILSQIENELGGDYDDPYPATDTGRAFVNVSSDEFVFKTPDNGISYDNPSLRPATLEDYAEWCGQLARNVAPNVVWTMCNGLAVNSTLMTFNGAYFPANWLENHGTESGRIQIDQPPLWTEEEAGFQIWGDDPQHPSDYISGRTAREMAHKQLQWVARGGTHFNYYMYWGGYNRERAAAAGILNAYATDAPLCPSGERREPKYSHFERLHKVLHEIAPVLVQEPTALGQENTVEVKSSGNQFLPSNDGQQKLFIYQGSDGKEVAFLEHNDKKEAVVVRIWLENGSTKHTLTLQPESAVIFVEGKVVFDSARLPSHSHYQRQGKRYEPTVFLEWKAWQERIGVADQYTLTSTSPVEQTELMVKAAISSDYAWYETNVVLRNEGVTWQHAVLQVDTQHANALLVYWNGEYVGSADTHKHEEGGVTLLISLDIPDLTTSAAGTYKLAILSESLGYGNLLGRWGATTKPKLKGLTGRVRLILTSHESKSSKTMDLVSETSSWRGMAGLHGERAAQRPGVWRRDLRSGSNDLEALISDNGDPTELVSVTERNRGLPLWSSALFKTPTTFDADTQILYLDVDEGRGHVWLNGLDLGRYWNITQEPNSTYYSQRYYMIPPDWLVDDYNELVFLDVTGRNFATSRLVASWIEPAAGDDQRGFEDEVGFPSACL